MKSFFHPSDLPAFGMLAIDGVRGLTNLVEDLHRKIAGMPPDQPARGIPGLVYTSLRGVTDLAGTLGAPLAHLVPVLEEQRSTAEREAMLAALNGVLGDHMAATNNALAIRMGVRHNGQSLKLDEPSLAASFPQAGRKLLVLVHGLCMNDLHWRQQEHDHGEALARDLGFTPIYLVYNSGQHISTNGRAFAGQLDALVRHWPAPVEELVILAHSMGGLVTRSACYSAAVDGQAWLSVLRKLVFLGTPHHGSPLERGGSLFQAALGVNAYSAPFARLGKIRSAGITDMRYGSLLDEDWENRDRFVVSHDRRRAVPLPEGVQCYTIGAVTKRNTPGPVNAFIGDGLVPLKSALGIHPDPRLSLQFPESHQWVGYGMNHLDLLRKPEVYAQIRGWLAG